MQFQSCHANWDTFNLKCAQKSFDSVQTDNIKSSYQMVVDAFLIGCAKGSIGRPPKQAQFYRFNTKKELKQHEKKTRKVCTRQTVVRAAEKIISSPLNSTLCYQCQSRNNFTLAFSEHKTRLLLFNASKNEINCFNVGNCVIHQNKSVHQVLEFMRNACKIEEDAEFNFFCVCNQWSHN